METQIEVKFKDDIIKGILITEDENFMTIKLSSGYNSVLKKENVKVISKKEVKIDKKELSPREQNSKLPKILILHTGGTIASKVDYETGAVKAQTTPEELFNLYPEILDLANIETKLIGNILSGDLNVAHWNLILNAIKENLSNDICGIIISHGTDTMSYTAPALQYALSNIPCPIILVGSQRSSDRPGADAYLNLRRSIEFILNQKDNKVQFRRVGVGMYSNLNDDEVTIFDSINVKKSHSSRRDAFKQINFEPFAKISENNYIEFRPELKSTLPENNLEISLFDENIKIGIFKSHPSLRPEEINLLSYYDAVIIEGTGFGNLHVNEVDSITKFGPKNLEALKKLQETTKVIVVSQTGSGVTALNVYNYGKKIKDTGVYGNFMNLISETQYSRIAHLLSIKKFEELWETQIEGFELIDLDK